MEEEKKVETIQSTQSQNVEAKKDVSPEPTSSSPEVKVQNPGQPTVSISSSTPKKINNKTWIFIGICIILIIAIILILTIHPKSNTGTVIEKDNISYSIYSQNVLADSGNSLFTKGSIWTTLGLASNKLDQEINAMQQGQEKNITLEPKDAFGTYDPSLVFSLNRTEVTEASGLPSRINRTSTQNRTLDISNSIFTQAFSEQPVLNKVYTRSSINYKVVAIAGDNVTLSIELKVGDTFPSGLSSFGLNTTVTAVTDKTITVRIDGTNQVTPSKLGSLAITLDSSYVYFEFTPIVGKSLQLSGYPTSTVIQVNSTHVLLDANVPGAGQIITVDVKLLNKVIERIPVTGNSIKNIPGAPTMQVFIMSHCPYGTQIVKGLLPVWKALKDKANIELRFVSYTMHGAQEDLDNNRIMCIREEQSSKLIDYLDCYVHADGTESGAQSCIAQVGVDKTKLDSCVSTNAAGYYDVDKQLNTQYSVQGSPTVIIDGKEASIYPRDPASVAKALCDAFTTKPSECSQSFSTTNPAPGFGPDGTSGSSGTNASCG